MNAEVLKFRQEINDKLSAELQEKLKSVTLIDDFIALAKKNGHDFTIEELVSTYEEIQDSDEGLTEFELDSVSGGGFFSQLFGKW